MPYKQRKWPWGKMLDYITARQAQDRLDEVCGMENWKVDYKELRGELFAGVSIKIGDEWITKWDWWSETSIEKEKGAISDSFKRACVCWGLGRFLYPESEATVVPKEKFTKKQYKEIVSAFNDGGTELAQETYKDLSEDYDVEEVKDKMKELWKTYKDNQAISEDDMERIWKDLEWFTNQVKNGK